MSYDSVTHYYVCRIPTGQAYHRPTTNGTVDQFVNDVCNQANVNQVNDIQILDNPYPNSILI